MRTESEDRLEQWLITNILESEDCDAYLGDILRGGCQNGVISELIYYKDVYPFFQEYYLEIEESVLEIQEEYGAITLQADIQSHLTWLAVEKTASTIASKLGLS